MFSDSIFYCLQRATGFGLFVKPSSGAGVKTWEKTSNFVCKALLIKKGRERYQSYRYSCRYILYVGVRGSTVG